jgi:hypothetical protein
MTSTANPRTTRTRWVAAVGVVTVVALIGAAGVAWFTHVPVPVVFIGDSITDQARPALEQRFGVPDDSVKAVGGKKIEDMMDAAKGLAATNPAQAVIDLGTNDVLADEPAAPNGAELTQMIGLFSSADCIHVVTINEHMLSPTFGNVGQAAAALNQQIDAIAQQNPKVHVIDWDKTVLDYDAAHDPDGPITVDTVHPTPMGQQMLVDGMQRSVDACRR